jgi:ribonuclease HI
MSQAVQLHIAGVCQKQRGPGAWGAVLSKGTAQKELAGIDEETTLHRAEMTALINALGALSRPCRVEVYSGSEYLIKGCCEWLANWKRMDWRTTNQQPVKNADLWAQLDEHFQRHALVFQYLNEAEPGTHDRRAKKLANKGLHGLQEGLKASREADYNRRYQTEDGSIMKPIRIYTDGSCLRDRTGGWGAVILNESKKNELSGSEHRTTSNRMEMLAVIQALEAIDPKLPARVTTDSKYVKRGMEDWLKQWKQTGWLTTEGEPVKNDDLWQRLDEICSERHITWQWVKGHSGHKHNERADALARAALTLASALAARSRSNRALDHEVAPSGP